MKTVEGGPREKFHELLKFLIKEKIGQFNLAMRFFAGTEPLVMEQFIRTENRRLELVRMLFVELGFEGDDLEARTRTFYMSVQGENFTTLQQTTEERLDAIESQLDFFLSK